MTNRRRPPERWAQYGEKPDYAGLLTFAGVPITQDPAELEGFDVAMVGAPMDDLVSDRPGARLAPRAIRAASWPPGPHLEVEVDAFAALRVVDFGDAAVVPAAPARSHAAIEAIVGQVLRRARSRSCSAATTRSPSRRSGPARRPRPGRRSCTSTPTRTPARPSSASTSRTARSSAA